MNTSSKFAVMAVVLGLVFALPGLFAVAGAGAFQGGTASGKISLLQSDRPVYVPRTTAIFNIEVENDGAVAQDYQLTVVAYGPSGDEIFRSNVERINSLPPGDRRLVQFQWATSSRTESGAYTLTADLRDQSLFDVLFDTIGLDDGVKFEVQAKSLIFLSGDEVDFGDFLPGETPEINLFVSNTGNGILEWKVESVADDWIELVTPIGDVRETATITLRVKQDAPISRQLSGDLVITSNGGDRVLPITGNVLGVHSASLERLRTVKGLYRQGETMAMEYLVTNDGTVPLVYSAAVTLKGPDGRIVYDAMSAGENVRLSLEAEASQSVNFVWEIPLEEPVGYYEAYVALTYWFDPDLIFYDALNDTFMRATSKPLINQLFEVKEGPRLVVDPLEWDYGTVLVEQDTGSANFQITNSGGATLEWELVSWPDWIMIAKPTIFTNIGGGNILARVRPSLTPDDYSGAIRVESNGGDISLPISIRITSPSTPTPLPTATVEPTATPPPIAPTATPAPQSPTATPRANRPAPAPPTNTPVNATSTAVPANARPAATATPVLIAQATVESTPGSSGVGCSVPLGNVSLASGLVNGLLLVAPLGLIAGARYGRRRSKHSSKWGVLIH